jgi:hypothetical protein
MHQMKYEPGVGAWLGTCQGKLIRVEEATMQDAQELEAQAGLPPWSRNPTFWWNHRNQPGVSYTFYQPEHNILEILCDRSVEVLPVHYRRAFLCDEFTRIETHHYAIFQTDLKGWASTAQLDVLSQFYDHGDGPDYKLDHLLSAEDARNEE